uniref:Uncharacterized protein n=1 Tax=Otus sunia TaxID=257818 RepID=A0A8C8A802_9STRI
NHLQLTVSLCPLKLSHSWKPLPPPELREQPDQLRSVSTALNESDVLQKMAEEAAKKKPNAKPIKEGWEVSAWRQKRITPR